MADRAHQFQNALEGVCGDSRIASSLAAIDRKIEAFERETGKVVIDAYGFLVAIHYPFATVRQEDFASGFSSYGLSRSRLWFEAWWAAIQATESRRG